MNKITIGLEIHIEAETETKMFCDCLNDPNEKHPNVNVCPICLGHPGTLPVPNKRAVELVVMLGIALGGRIADRSHFDRKSYFYPDLPKGYQISQYEAPLVVGGELNGIRIRRIHLEEDTGRLLHSEDKTSSLVDFNRAGVPLIELVTEPDLKSAKETVEFARELQLILRYLGVSQADMEKGQMRIEANISVEGGAKVELKNINSFKAVHDALEYEIGRQLRAVKEKKGVTQETRGWDEAKKKTVLQRTKESAHDYRYFPEPDIPPLNLGEWDLEKIKSELPELPSQKRKRFKEEYNFPDDSINLLVQNKKGADYFEQAASEFRLLTSVSDYSLLFNYFIGDLRGLMNERSGVFEDLKITPENFAHLVALVHKGELSSRLAKDLLVKMFESGKDPEVLVKEGGLKVIGDEEELEKIAKEVIKENKKAVEDYRSGKKNALQFLVGKLMARTRGQADPETALSILKKFL